MIINTNDGRGLIPIEEGGTNAKNVNDALENFGINPHSWNNALKVGNFIIQFGVTESVTVPANNSVQKIVTFEDWNYGNTTPVVLVKPIINTAFDLVEVNLTAITPTYAVFQFVNKYSSQLTWKANWIAIAKRA